MLSNKVCIDLGTTRTRVSVRGKSNLVEEPTVVAVSQDSSQNYSGDSFDILAIGKQAQDMLGRSPEDIIPIKPLKNGVIAEYNIAEVFLKNLLSRSLGRTFLKPDILLSVPSGATSVESRAVLDVAYNVGAKSAYLIPSPLAASIGAGLPVSQPSGNIIVSMGGGITETAVVSLYGIVAQGSLRLGGEDLTQSIIAHIRRKYGLVIGEGTAEDVKIKIGDALALSDEILEVKGRDSITGFPRIAEISSKEVNEDLQTDLQRIACSIKDVLEKTPPELSSDVLDKGIVLCGGSSLMKNVDKYISEYIGVPVHVAESPTECTIKGLQVVLEHLDKFSKVMIRH